MSAKTILSIGKTVRVNFDGIELIGKISHISASSIEVQMTVPFKGVRLRRDLEYSASETYSYLDEYGVETAHDLLRQIYLNCQKIILEEDYIRDAYPDYLERKHILSRQLASLHEKYDSEESRTVADELSFEYLEHLYQLHSLEESIRDLSVKLILLPDRILRNGNIPLGFVRTALHPLLGLRV